MVLLQVPKRKTVINNSYPVDCIVDIRYHIFNLPKRK